MEKMAPAHFAHPDLQTARVPGEVHREFTNPLCHRARMESSITPLIYPCHFPVESRPGSSHWRFLSHPLDEDLI